MSQQPIVRNVTTLDRGPVVRVTTEDVLKAAKCYGEEFTTREIAFELDVDEYPVRMAVSWLVKRGIFEKVGTTKRKLSPPIGRRLHGSVYPVSLYQVKEQSAPVDFAALNRAFGYA